MNESAAQQAARLGLEGDGHGGWYKHGEFVAKTEKGRLKFYNKRQRKGQDPPQSEKEKNLSHTTRDKAAAPEPPTERPSVEMPGSPAVDPAAQRADDAYGQAVAQQQAVPATPQDVYTPPEVPKTKGTLTVAFGRFNPPHLGHGQLMDVAAGSVRDSESESDYIIYPSQSTGKDTDPLDFETKVAFMKQMFPDHASHISDDTSYRTIFDVLKSAHMNGYANVRIIAGGKRVKQFEKLSNDYNGALYAFDNLETINAGDRDDDAEGVEGMSASKARQAVLDGDRDTFDSQLPDGYDGDELFNAVQNALGSEKKEKKKEKKEVKEWKVAPKFHARKLREYYINEEIYNIGDRVENLSNGFVGRIIRRGPSYVICVTEDKIMFKSWITEVVESNKPDGVPADQRLVGTDSLRKYTERMVPGSAWGIQFINKYRKNK